jgi:4-diphosphocytidyl-2-C-methyl-D-erythritol kinase
VPPFLTARAGAKINLTLHVLGRRADGYHSLESLVAFAGIGDTLQLTPGAPLALAVDGPNAALAGENDKNLVLKAARLLAERVNGLQLGAFHLTKRLPVAAGIGGGSSDAAAALRLLARLNGLKLTDPAIFEAARRTGADVSVCLDPRTRMMRGVGDELGPKLRLPRLPAVLVNPGVAVETPAVFRALGLPVGQRHAGPPHPDIAAAGSFEALVERLRGARNDLEGPAIAVAPVIEDALGALSATRGCRLARMSGSGGTVFGIYEDSDVARAAARTLRTSHHGWWVRATSLR